MAFAEETKGIAEVDLIADFRDYVVGAYAIDLEQQDLDGLRTGATSKAYQRPEARRGEREGYLLKAEGAEGLLDGGTEVLVGESQAKDRGGREVLRCVQQDFVWQRQEFDHGCLCAGKGVSVGGVRGCEMVEVGKGVIVGGNVVARSTANSGFSEIPQRIHMTSPDHTSGLFDSVLK